MKTSCFHKKRKLIRSQRLVKKKSLSCQTYYKKDTETDKNGQIKVEIKINFETFCCFAEV